MRAQSPMKAAGIFSAWCSAMLGHDKWLAPRQIQQNTVEMAEKIVSAGVSSAFDIEDVAHPMVAWWCSTFQHAPWYRPNSYESAI